MTKELIEQTKKAIGYTEQQNTCRDCKHSKEVDGTIDRTWDWICNVSNICPMSIKPEGRCNLFARKDS
jgi:hypothetical protein